MPEFTFPGQPAVETTAGDIPSPSAESALTISPARIFSPGAAPIPEFTFPGQPAVETRRWRYSEPDGNICSDHINSPDLQSGRRPDAGIHVPRPYAG
jgi:hypothetical protein